MSVLRSTTFQLEVKSESGKTNLRSFMRATSDADAMVKKLNAELGDNTTVTYKTAQSVKELTAQARLQITAFEKTQKAYNTQSEQLNHNLSLIGKSASEQAALTAQFNLGSNATDKQRAAVGELAGQLSILQQAEKEAAAEAASLAAKEKALTAANEKQSAKTSEMISRYTTMNKLLKEYDGDLQRVNATMSLGSNATASQIATMDRLVQSNQKLRGATGKSSKSFRGLRGQMQNLGWQAQDVAVQLQMGTDKMIVFSQQGSQIASGFGPAGAVVGALIAVVGAMTPFIYKMVTGKASAEELAAALKILNSVFDEGETSADGLSTSYEKLFKRNKELAILTAKQAQFAAQDNLKASRDNLKKLTKEYFNVGKAVDKATVFAAVYQTKEQAYTQATKARTAAVKKQAKELGITVEQYEAINKEVLEGATGKASQMMIDLGVNSKGANKALVNQAMAFATLADKESTYAQRADALKKIMSGDVEVGAGSGDSDAIKAFEAEYARTIKQTETLDEQYKRRKKIVDDYLKTKNADHKKANEDILALDEWLKEEQGKVDQEKYDKQVASMKAFNKSIAGLYTEKKSTKPYDIQVAQLKEAKEKLKAIELASQRDFAKGIITSEQLRTRDLAANKAYGKAKSKADEDFSKNSIEYQQAQTQSAINTASSLANSISGSIDMLSTGADEIKAKTEDMNDTQKAMFFVTQAIAAAQAYVQGAALGMQLGAQMGWGAPAGIAFGNALGATQAGIIMGTTFAGMFDKGGVIPAGQKGIVAEYGDELVGGTMVYNNSSSGLNVTGREDTAKMMGGSTMMNVNINNTASGVVSATATQIDEETVDIKIAQYFSKNIDSGVASVFNKSSSKASKSLRNNYRTQRKV